MKVLLVTESYWPNADGGALFERRLALGLAGRGHTVTVWTPGKDFSNYTEPDGPYTILRERAVTFWANKKYKVSFMPFWRARRVIKAQQPDIIHIHNCYWMGLSAMFWARHYRIPVIATNHFMPENALLNLKATEAIYGPLHQLIWNFLISFHNKANYVTSPTPTAVKLLTDHGLRTQAQAISNGIDADVFKTGLDTSAVQSKYGIAKDRPVLLYVGRLDGEKRLDIIIAAFAQAHQEIPLQLVLCGFGKSMDQLKAQAAKLGVQDDVVFTGYIDEEDKPAIYNAGSIFIISSPAELQSIVTLEAMACGLPVLAVDIAALKELCHDGKNGYLFPLDDIPAVAGHILRLASNASLAQKMGKESTKIIQQLHTNNVMVESYEEAYQRTIRTTKQ
jgi:glycosyltransferase involved in cell wall biosynthesis